MQIYNYFEIVFVHKVAEVFLTILKGQDKGDPIEEQAEPSGCIPACKHLAHGEPGIHWAWDQRTKWDKGSKKIREDKEIWIRTGLWCC